MVFRSIMVKHSDYKDPIVMQEVYGCVQNLSKFDASSVNVKHSDLEDLIILILNLFLFADSYELLNSLTQYDLCWDCSKEMMSVAIC